MGETEMSESMARCPKCSGSNLNLAHDAHKCGVFCYKCEKLWPLASTESMAQFFPIARLQAERDAAQERVNDMVRVYEKDEVWHWQGDGEDHLESLTCPIIIRPEQLRTVIAKAEAERDELLGALQAMQKAVEQLMPGLVHIAVQDYANINEAPILAKKAIAKVKQGESR